MNVIRCVRSISIQCHTKPMTPLVMIAYLGTQTASCILFTHKIDEYIALHITVILLVPRFTFLIFPTLEGSKIGRY